MAWAMVAAAAVSAVGSIVSSNSASAQNETQSEWNTYNAQMGYNTAISNIQSQRALGLFNAQLQLQAAEYNSEAILDMAEYNSEQIQVTMDYNNLLLEEEEVLLWESMGLDLQLLEAQRLQERGEIVATQGSSGTTIGVGSNKEVVIAQKAEEAMDAFVIRHNADIGAADIQNAMAQNIWEGKAQIQKTMYEGQVNAATTMNNARLSAVGTMVETEISASAAKKTAEYELSAGLSGASQTYSANEATNSNNLTNGLFSAAGSAVSSYYGSKSIDSGSSSLMTE